MKQSMNFPKIMKNSPRKEKTIQKKIEEKKKSKNAQLKNNTEVNC